MFCPSGFSYFYDNIAAISSKVMWGLTSNVLLQLSRKFSVAILILHPHPQKKVSRCALEHRQVDVKRIGTCNSYARSNWTLWKLFRPGISQKKVLVCNEKFKKLRFHVSCETASSDRGFHSVTGIRRSSVSLCSQKGETFVVLLCRQFKNGRPIRNMVKCGKAQYDLILYVIGVDISWCVIPRNQV